IGHDVRLVEGNASARIEDVAIDRTRSGEWVVSELFVRLPKPATPFARGDSRTVKWSQIRLPSDSTAPQSAERLIQTMVDLKPADLAEALLELPDTRMIEVVGELPDDRVADALEEMVESDQLELLAQLPRDRAANVLDRMEPDDAADLISALPE